MQSILQSNIRATEWWLNHGNPSGGTKMCHFLHEVLFERLRIVCTKMFTAELMDISGLCDLNEKKVEELLQLSSGLVCNPRSKRWPRQDRYEKAGETAIIHALECGPGCTFCTYNKGITGLSAALCNSGQPPSVGCAPQLQVGQQPCSLMSFSMNCTQAMVVTLHDCSFSHENVANFLSDPFMFCTIWATLKFLELCLVPINGTSFISWNSFN